MVDSRNEGIRVYLMRFIETIVICQTPKSEFSDLSKLNYDMSLNQISRGHRFISYRKLETEATLSFKNLLDHLASSRTSLLHLISALTAVARIARARPEFVHQMVEAFESLHQNLPPTLGRGQVKSVRKELKNNLLRMLKHPTIFLKHIGRVKNLLTELGATKSEIDRFSPAPAELSEALKKQVEQMNALKRMESSTSSNIGPLAKKLKLEDEDYDDQKLGTAFDDQEEATKAKQKAIDLTTDWIMERMGGGVVPKLVFINLLTMPDEMPPAFNASYYTIPEVLTNDVKRNVARLLANQFNREGKGPGANFYAEEKKKYFMMKQKAKQEGAIIPPTPADLRDDKHGVKMDSEGFKVPILPVGTKKPSVKFDIFAETQPLTE
uniref:Symplekin/Pta1 N-terminal domain-containing protein n=1 Tax=Panagrolaimus sp. JU765 TaxID=591449 RepID=A0AC34R2Y1_9BILA